jgi:hypothetical protein
VLPNELSLRDFAKIKLRTSVRISHNDFSFLVQRDKTDLRYEGNRVVIQHSSIGSDPFSLFTRYLASRDSHFLLHPYLWLRYNGQPPSRLWFVRKMKSFLSLQDGLFPLNS